MPVLPVAETSHTGERDTAMETISSSRIIWLSAGLLAVPLLVLAAHSIELIDDAYITGRYALNLARGDGLVFNQGEYVEGMTNLLWALVLALPMRFGFSFVDTAIVLGVGFGMMSLLWSLRLSRLLGATPVASYGAALALAINPPFWRYVSSGLEGGLFAFLLAATLESSLSRRSLKLTGLLAGLLFMTRPESGLVAIIVAGYLASAPSQSTVSVRQRVGWALELLVTFACVAGAATLFRFSYYGAILPNSVTAKSLPRGDLTLLVDNLRIGTVYLFKFCWNALPLAIGAALSLFVAKGRARWLLLLVFAAEIPAVLHNGGDWMPHYRLLIVYGPLLVPLLAVSIDGLRRVLSTGQLQRVAGGSTLLLLALGSVAILARSLVHLRPNPTLHGGLIECYGAVGERLAAALKPTEVATSEALGLVAYQLRDVYVHDALGLTDKWVARNGAYRPRVGRVDYAYTYHKIHPAVFLLHESDLRLADFQTAGGRNFADDYRAYSIAPPPPCTYSVSPPLLIAVRNDVHQRVYAALEGLSMVPIARSRGDLRTESSVAPAQVLARE